MNFRKITWKHAATAIIIILVIALSLTVWPIEMKYTKSRYGRVYSARKWFLIRGNDGILISAIKDNLKGVNHDYKVHQFERGESANVSLREDLYSGKFVLSGDTAGIVYASSINADYIESRGKLNVAKAELAASMTGDKKSVINQYEKQLELAKTELSKQQRIVERLQKLYDKRFISEEEFQIASDELRILELAAASKEAELTAISSGEKQQEIARLKTYIRSIEDELKNIEKEQSGLIITAPFSGYVERSFGSDTLLILAEADRFLITFPVPVDDYSLIDKNSTIEIITGKGVMNAEIIEISNFIHQINGKDNLLVHAFLTTKNTLIYPGMMTEITIKGRDMNLLPYLANVLNN